MGKIAKKTTQKTKIKKPKVKTMKPKIKLLGKPKQFKKIHEIVPKRIETEDAPPIDALRSDEENPDEFQEDNIVDGTEENSDLDVDMEANGETLDSEDEVQDHQQALERLRDTDPEFYKFLQDNDKRLLNFNVSDDENSSEDGQDPDVHVPGGELEVASDESDYEGDDADEPRSKRVITLKQIKLWQQSLQNFADKSNHTIVEVVKAFSAALKTINTMDAGDNAKQTYYKVEGSAVFNATIQLCVLYLGPAVRNFLQLRSKQPPHKSKKFIKIKTALKSYFADLLKLLECVSSGNILNVLLKHLHYMCPLLISFPNVTKPLLKRLITFWGTSSNEPVRVVAFLSILRIVNNQKDMFLDKVLKTMYMTYVKNAKFISVNTLPGVNFMRRSLVELFALDLNVAYQHVFLYIRQLAINLRNAVIENKKENTQIVYNWQYVNSCRLWGTLLGQTSNRPQLQALIYPFVQVCLGCLKLVPTAAYFPLRFHMVQILMDLSKDSGIYVPLLPFLTEVLTTFDFNKKHAKVSMKPLAFNTALRMGKAQMSENGFKDAIIDSLYACLLEYLAAHSQSVAFPDMAIFPTIQIKLFLKKCSVANYQRKMSQLLEKIDQNSKFIETERKRFAFTLTERKKIEAWETTIKNNGTPLGTFYENWNKVRNIRKGKLATNNEEIGDYNLPALTKKTKVTTNGRVPRSNVDSDGNVVLFPSDSEDDEVEEEEVQKSTKRGKRAGKNINKAKHSYKFENVNDHNDVGDTVEDITDW